MIVTMDSAGRIVIPKAIRDRDGLAAGAEFAIRAEPGAIVLQVRHAPVRIELRDGLPVMLPVEPRPVLTAAAVGAVIARHRGRGLAAAIGASTFSLPEAGSPGGRVRAGRRSPAGRARAK